MPVIGEYSLPKGSTGMTQLGGTNDDSTVTLPDIGFDFWYNGSVIRQLYTSGNTWVGFGTSSEHLAINRRDTSYNKLLYAHESEYGVAAFRIRFEGNVQYNNWGRNDLVWELTLFQTGVIRLVLEKTPNSSPNRFFNPNVGTQTLSFVEGRSYIFTPNDITGKNYVIEEGSYIPSNSKFLMADSDGIKTFQTIEGVSSWAKVGDLPLTEEMFLTHGLDILPTSMEGLSDNAPVLFHYTDNPNVLSNKSNHRIQVSQIVTSNPKLIIQQEDFIIDEGKSISKIEAIVTTTRKDASGNDIDTQGQLRIAISVDGGISWLTFNNIQGTYEEVDINDIPSFLVSGIRFQDLLSLNYEALNGLIQPARRMRFAYLLDKPMLEDVCKLRKMKIFYN